MNILSCGAGMQSTALALISCDQTRNKVVYPQVPRYDAIIYCDLGCEPAWVADQVRFIERACVDCNIPFLLRVSLNAEETVTVFPALFFYPKAGGRRLKH